MVRKTKEDAEKTRTSLLDAAEFVFLEKGLNAASLNDIARRAGVTRGAVYWHFENKESLFQALHERVKLPVEAVIEEVVRTTENPLTALKDICVYALRNLARDEHTQRVYTIIQNASRGCEDMADCAERQRSKRQGAIARFVELLDRAHGLKLLKRDVVSETAALGLYAYINGLFGDFLRNPGTYDLEAMAPVFMDAYIQGIAA